MSCVGEQFFGRGDTQVRGAFVGRRDVPGRDAGLAVDQVEVPLGKQGGQLVVGFDPLGQVDRDGTDCRVFHRSKPRK